MELEEGVGRDFLGDVTPADRARGRPQHGRQVPTIDIIERHGPGSPHDRWSINVGEGPVYAAMETGLWQDHLHVLNTHQRRYPA
jgi:hypothetical protein